MPGQRASPPVQIRSIWNLIAQGISPPQPPSRSGCRGRGMASGQWTRRDQALRLGGNRRGLPARSWALTSGHANWLSEDPPSSCPVIRVMSAVDEVGARGSTCALAPGANAGHLPAKSFEAPWCRENAQHL
jgi:hypothetical protein